MNIIAVKNGMTEEIIREAYKIVSALDKIERPAIRVQALCFLVAMLGELLDTDSRSLYELGDNIATSVSFFEPDQYKAFKDYAKNELKGIL